MFSHILASSSPRRIALLAMLNLGFKSVPSSVEEPLPSGEKPEEYAMHLSLLKAYDVAQNSPQSMIVGADTIVVIDGNILGKPASAEEAFEMLQTLSGRTHEVITGVTFLKTDTSHTIIDKKTFFVRTRVTFSPLNVHEIHRYIATGSPFDKAGGYGIQDDTGALFVERIDGDYYNVVGFPLNQFYQEMKSFYPELFTVNTF